MQHILGVILVGVPMAYIVSQIWARWKYDWALRMTVKTLIPPILILIGIIILATK